jgi:hypothetical protein
MVVVLWPNCTLFGQSIHLKSRDVQTDSSTQRTPLAPSDARSILGPHQLIQFNHEPGADDLAALVNAGYRVLNAVPDNAVLVLAPNGRTAEPAIAGVTWQGALQPADKLSPLLDLSSGQPVGVLIEFFPDVSVEDQASVLAVTGLVLQKPAFLLAKHVLATASVSALQSLANRDEIAYIFPADPNWTTSADQILPCIGMLTMAGPVGQYANLVHGWDLDSDHVAHLNYFFGSLTAKVPANTVQSEILRAVSAWTAAGAITFTATSNASALRTVVMKFVSGNHGDAFPFDGPGGILAHTYYPVPVNGEPIAGDIHLDADENWHAGSDLDVYSVVLHELGHALGLAHSDKPGDVMYPYYRRGMTLSANDIGAIQSLYGPPAGSPAPLTNPPVSLSNTTPLSLTLNPVSPPDQAAAINLSGTVSGGAAPLSLQYETDRGSAGRITLASSGSWSAVGIPLAVGANTITVTALDFVSHTASKSVTVARSAPASGSIAPVSLRITTPAGAMAAAKGTTISLAGAASSENGIAEVTWQTSNGISGVATGTTNWVATSVPLLTGTNRIVVRAYDAAGGTAWGSVIVLKQ